MEVGTQYDFVLPSRQSLGVGSLIPRDFIPGLHAPLYGVFQTLLSDNSGPFQHRDAEASEILFSGFSVPLVVIPLDFFPDPRDFLTVFHAPLMASSRRCTDHKVQTQVAGLSLPELTVSA
ncbi:MAG: hypothetical protein IKK68_05785, partial [Paludibacteraceae bacterium]|nr:hypothetical protein [Paludibacteraceae bacterium]